MLINIAISILLLSLTPSAYAATSANVEINNNVSSNSNSQTNSYTNITVETNGQVTRYESDKPGNVEVKSTNGESSIKVNGEEVNPNITNKPSSSASPTGVINDDQRKNHKKNIEVKKEFFINMLRVKLMFLRQFFSFLH